MNQLVPSAARVPSYTFSLTTGALATDIHNEDCQHESLRESIRKTSFEDLPQEIKINPIQKVNKMILNILILIRIKIKIYIINNPSKRENSSFEQLGYIIIMWY